MKRRGLKFWEIAALAFVAFIIVCTASAVWLRFQLTSDQHVILLQILQKHIGPILLIVLLILIISAWAVDSIFRKTIRPIRKIAEEISLINPNNPSHRIQIRGGDEVRQLCDRINDGAAHYESLIKNIEDRVRTASAQAEEERNFLSAIMSELPEGAIVCNQEGQILLYNNQAKMLLEGPGIARKDSDSANDSVRIIGLGRSIFGIFNENLIRHAIDQITDKLERNYPDVISSFVSQGTGGTLLRVEMVPVLNPGRRYSGLILILHDITQQLDTHNYLNLSLQSLTRGIRASLAGIRSAIENILEYPDMNPTQLETLKQIIHKESLNIGEFLEQDPTLSTTNPMFGQWPLVRITVRNLLELLQARCRESLNVDIRIENIDSEHFVNVDHYSFLLAMLFVIQQVKTATDANEFTCRLTELRRFVGIDVLWSGKPLQGDSFRVWEKQPLVFKKEGLSLTLREVIDHHNGELGFYTSKRLKDTSYMRFFLPVVYLVKPEKKRSPTILAASRPEFYDFDLFQQLGQIPELENRKLAELTFTVFDLETTGLHPDEGDEIIAVGAFRIVNCRLLHDECFEQLVNPQRSIPWTSVKIHGIHPEMLEGQPTINEVLPRFHDFAKDTILVGHNAAFDMRFLKLKEGKTGVRFTYPVLDTLLLSAAVHPAQEDHNLEAIAQRLGVRILARHTATGDALATGELFLKFLPLLAQKNIYTLKDALAASEKTYYARKGY